MAASLLFGDAASVTAQAHPAVLLGILDSYMRRDASAERVIGTLLGSAVDGQVLLRSCFTVPFVENEDSLVFDMEYQQKMLDLHLRQNPNNKIVGWFSTGLKEHSDAILIHLYYKGLCADPVYLVVDPNMTTPRLNYKCHVSSSVEVNQKSLDIIFYQIPIKLAAQDAEKFSVEALIKARDVQMSQKTDSAPLASELGRIEASMTQLTTTIDRILAYVNKVRAGELPANADVGQALMEALDSLPKFSVDDFEGLFQGNVQDYLMAVYLANLAKAQLTASEKLLTA